MRESLTSNDESHLKWWVSPQMMNLTSNDESHLKWWVSSQMMSLTSNDESHLKWWVSPQTMILTSNDESHLKLWVSPQMMSLASDDESHLKWWVSPQMMSLTSNDESHLRWWVSPQIFWLKMRWWWWRYGGVFPSPEQLLQPAVVTTNTVLKGQSNEVFHLHFFSLFGSAWATDRWVKILSILVKILRSYLNFRLSKRTRRGILPGEIDLQWYDSRGVMFWCILYWLARV